MKKSIYSFLLIFVLIVVMLPLAAGAASSEIIDNAEIDAVINTDGTVNVTEKWTVSYINAADSFFRKFDIYSSDSALTLLQKYDEIKDVSVKIDGNTAPESPDGVNTYSFMKAADGKSYDIVINCPSAQITREYEVSYTICGAVKKNSGDADFSFMFIGKTFPYTSNNVTVTVHVPEGTDAERIGVPGDSDAVIDGNTVKFTAKRVYDTFAIDTYFEDSAFEPGALASYSSMAESMKKAKDAVVDVLPYIAAVIFVIAVILFVLMPDRLVRFSAEKRALKRVSANEQTDCLPGDISACQAYKILMPASRVKPKSTSKKVPALFAMAVLECIEKGYIIADDDKLIVGTPDNESAYILSVINFLKTFCEKSGNRYVIDKTFAEKVAAECSMRYDVMANYLASFYSLIPGADKKIFSKKAGSAVYEDIYMLKIAAAEMKKKPSFAECLANVSDGAKTGEVSVFAMLFASQSDKIFAASGSDGATALCNALSAMFSVYVKSK